MSFIIADRHTYLRAARFSNDARDLAWIDWPLLQARDFRRDPDDPGKLERYQAEALARNHVPLEALVGMACHNESVTREMEAIVHAAGEATKVKTRTDWYFR